MADDDAPPGAPAGPAPEASAEGATGRETGDASGPATDVPAGETPAARCPHCGRPFGRERLRDLHLGEVHPETIAEAERAAHEAAREAEDEELFMFHMKVVAALALVYCVLVLVYMVVLTV